MISSEENELFTIDVGSKAFTTDALGSSDSESESEVPQFKISAFDRYISQVEDCKHISNVDFHSNNKVSNEDDFYVNVYPDRGDVRNGLASRTSKRIFDEWEKKNVVAKPGFETLEKVPPSLSRRQSKKLRLKEREKTKGFEWYNMPAPEMTEEKKNDLMVVQMRQALDPKHFYKRSVGKTNPKYFEVGTYVESPVDFYSSRIPKKQRKQTLVDELLSDADFRNYQKKKISEYLKSQPKFHRRGSKKKKEKSQSNSGKQKNIKKKAS